MFVVRKKAVFDAFKWLKDYNVEYSNIKIRESNLDWIENNTAQELPPSLIQIDDDKACKNLPSSVDMGLCQSQTLSSIQKDSQEASGIEPVLGVLPSLAAHLPKEKDAQLIDTLSNGLKQHNNKNH